MNHISAEPARFIRVGEFMVDRYTGVLEANGLKRRLRRKEIELLCYLLRCGAKPVSRHQILQDVWHCPNMITRTLDQTVVGLRRKLCDDSAKPRHLVTVYGFGYQLLTGLEPATPST